MGSAVSETVSEKQNFYETDQHAYDVARWHGYHTATEPMPPLGLQAIQNIGEDLLGDDHEIGFLQFVEQLHVIEDPPQRRATYLYALGYSDEDVQVATGVEMQHVQEAMEGVRKGLGLGAELGATPNEKVTKRRRAVGRRALDRFQTSLQREDSYVLKRRLNRVRVQWHKKIEIDKSDRSKGPSRVFDGVFTDGEIPDISAIRPDQRARLGLIFSQIYKTDHPRKAKEDLGEIVTSFLHIAVERFSYSQIMEQPSGARAKSFIYDNWGVFMLARRAKILQRVFGELQQGFIPKQPSAEELKKNPALEAIMSFTDEYKKGEHFSKLPTPFVSVLQNALSEKQLLELETMSDKARRTITYRLFDFFKEQDRSNVYDNSIKAAGRFSLALAGFKLAEISEILQENPYTTKTAFSTKYRDLFAEHAQKLNKIFIPPTEHIVSEEVETFSRDNETKEDGYQQYLTEIKKIRLLEPQEESEFAQQIEAGLIAAYKLDNNEPVYDHPLTRDEKRLLAQLKHTGELAKARMIESNLRLAAWWASKYISSPLPIADRTSAANVGLIHAVEKFDYTLGYKFSTYASKWIRRDLGQAMHKNSTIVYVPRDVKLENSAIKNRKDELAQQLGREPTIGEIAKDFKTPQKIFDILRDYPQEISLDKRRRSWGDVSYGDGLESVGDFVPDEKSSSEYDKVIARETISQVLKGLNDRERDMITYYYGLGGAKKLTLDELAGRHSINRATVSRRVESILEKLQSQVKDIESD